jgi:UDP-2,3-diacylglucosamine pyrophosphatase LpxH
MSKNPAYLILSDLHIGPRSFLGITAARLGARLIERCNPDTTTVIFAGDTFEHPHCKHRKQEEVFLDALRDFIRRGGKVVCIGGNHDRGPALQHLMIELGAEYHPDEYVVRVGKRRIYITHGDSGDTFLRQWGFVVSVANILYLCLQFLHLPTARFAKNLAKHFTDAVEKTSRSVAIRAAQLDCRHSTHGHTHIHGVREFHLPVGGKNRRVRVHDGGHIASRECPTYTEISLLGKIRIIPIFPEDVLREMP